MVEENSGLSPLDTSILESLKEGRMRFTELRDKLSKTDSEGKITNDKLNDRLKSLASYGYIRRIEQGHQKVFYELVDKDSIQEGFGYGRQSQSAPMQANRLLQRVDINNILTESHKHITETINSFSRENLFLEGLYVERSDLARAFQEFLAGPQVVFALVGETGLGKTSFLCKVASSMKDDIVVFLQGSSLTDDPLSKQIMDRLAPLYSIDDLLESLASERRRLVIIFDALNDYGPGRPERQSSLVGELNHLIYRSKAAKLKIIVTSRPYSWRLVADKLPRDKCYTSKSGLQFPLAPLNDAELKDAYALYQRKNDLRTDFDRISGNTRKNMRTPGLLRMISEAYRGSHIPAIAPAEKVFDLYYRKVILREDDIGTYPEEAAKVDAFVKTLVESMLDKKRGYLTREELDQIFVAERFRDSSNTILNGLLDIGFIRTGVGPFGTSYKFTYDWVFENLLSERILGQSGHDPVDSLLAHAKHARRFQYLYGALKSVLVRNADINTFIKFAKGSADNGDAQRILVEALSSLSDYYTDKSKTILNRLARDKEDFCKELAARTIAEMDNPDIDTQVELLMSAPDGLFDMVLEMIDMAWEKTDEPYPPVINTLTRMITEHLDIRRPTESALALSIRTMSVTFMNPAKLVLLRRTWMDCYRSIFDNPNASLKNKFKRIVVKAAANRFDPLMESLGIPPDDKRFLMKSSGEEKTRLMMELLGRYFKQDNDFSEDDYLTACQIMSSSSSRQIMFWLSFMMAGYLTYRAFVKDPEILQRMLAKSGDDVRPAMISTILTFARGNREASKLLVTDSIVQEVLERPDLFHLSMFDILMQSARDRDGNIPLAIELIRKCQAKGSIDELVSIVDTLSRVGVYDPRGASQALMPLVDHQNTEIKQAVIAAVQRIRIREPDVLEKYFDGAPPDFQSEVRLMKTKLGIRTITVKDGYAFATLFMPDFRKWVAHSVEKLAAVDDLKELKKILVKETINFLLDDNYFSNTMRILSENKREWEWRPMIFKSSSPSSNN